MNTITYLFFVKVCFFLFLGFDITLFALGYTVPGAMVLFGELFLMQRFYRCPECKSALDIRVPLRKMEYCPSCGCDFVSHKK